MASAAQTLHIDGDRVLVPASVFDHDGFRRWAKSDAFPERVRATFVAGEVLLEMSPESLESHSKVKGAITAALFDFVRERDLGELYPDGVLLTHPEAGLSCEPDLLFVTWETFEKDRVRLIERAERKAEYIEIEGTPDLVVEIVSDSSVRKDLVLLRNAYLRAGVPEYWLIDARDEVLRFEILENGGDGFRPTAAATEPQESRILRTRFSLTRSRNRLGRFAYRLETR